MTRRHQASNGEPVVWQAVVKAPRGDAAPLVRRAPVNEAEEGEPDEESEEAEALL